jgi:hypothetical protein
LASTNSSSPSSMTRNAHSTGCIPGDIIDDMRQRYRQGPTEPPATDPRNPLCGKQFSRSHGCTSPATRAGRVSHHWMRDRLRRGPSRIQSCGPTLGFRNGGPDA